MFNETHILHTTFQLTILLSLGFLGFYPKGAFSLALGGLMSCLAFRLLILDTTRLLQKAAHTPLSRKEVSRYSFKVFLKRCSMYAAALIVALVSPYLNFLVTLAGLLLPRLAIIFLMFRRRIIRGT